MLLSQSQRSVRTKIKGHLHHYFIYKSINIFILYCLTHNVPDKTNRETRMNVDIFVFDIYSEPLSKHTFDIVIHQITPEGNT